MTAEPSRSAQAAHPPYRTAVPAHPHQEAAR